MQVFNCRDQSKHLISIYSQSKGHSWMKQELCVQFVIVFWSRRCIYVLAIVRTGNLKCEVRKTLWGLCKECGSVRWRLLCRLREQINLTQSRASCAFITSNSTFREFLGFASVRVSAEVENVASDLCLTAAMRGTKGQTAHLWPLVNFSPPWRWRFGLRSWEGA